MRTGGQGGRADAGTPARVAAAVLLTAWVPLAASCTRAEPEATRHEVSIRAFRYEPARLTIAPGDTVVWINEDAVPHTATAADRTWNTGNIPSDRSGQVVPGGEGEYPYVCAFHPNMSGTLVVE